MVAARKMPVVFVGHGSPMNALEDNAWSLGFRALGLELPEPRTILAISAHWLVRGTMLTANERPPTIHDFGGFPRELYEIQYAAAGDLALARHVSSLLADWQATLSVNWGLDHGTWSVLRHLRPAADVPVVQLSLDARLPPTGHLAIGRALAPLRREGVLILGSGNVVHNLPDAFGRMRRGDSSTPDWAIGFDADVAQAVAQRDHDMLAHFPESEIGRQAHPTLDHYLPLLYAAGASDPSDAVRFPIQGFDMGSLSMRSVVWQ